MLLLWSFISQSQTVINKDSFVCFPKSIVREIQKDLLRKDLNDSIILIKDSMIINRNQKILLKDSIINSKNIQISLLKDNESAYKSQILLKDSKIESLEDRIKKQRKIIWGLGILEILHTVKDILSIFAK